MSVMRDGWTETTIGEVASINPKEIALAKDAPFVPMDAVKVGKRFVDYFEPRGERSGARAKSGDVLFARITPCLENGKVAQIQVGVGACGGSTEFIVVRGSEIIDSDFIYFWATLESTRDLAAGLMTGTTGRQRLSATDLGEIALNLPPLAEQKRIVDVVSSVDDYIDVLQQQVDTARTARKAVLHSICDAITSKFPLVDLNKRAEITDCEHKTAPETVIEHFYGFSVGTRDIRDGRILYHQAKKVSRDTFDSWSKRRLLKQGDLIYSREAPVGQIGYIDGSFPVCLGQRTVAISTQPVVLDSKFLSYWLDGTTVVNWISARSVGITVAHLNVADIKNIPIPNGITLGEQEDVVLLLSSMDDVIQSSEQALVDAKNLRSGLLSDLLSGEHEIPASYDLLLGAA